jgi:hypothetical protein
MGAWDGGVFGNDAALDFLGDLEEDGDVELVREALADAAGEGEDHHEAEPAGRRRGLLGRLLGRRAHDRDEDEDEDDLEDEGELDPSTAECALVAAEVVAAAAGQPTRDEGNASTAIAWARAHPEAGSAELVALARRAVERVADPQASELHALWHEFPGQGDDWDRAVADLRGRLASAAAAER